MEKTPQSMRKHVVIAGRTNAGKSTIFNALIGQDISIISSMPGTTTDPVRKNMELIPFGPIVLTDTAGLGDTSELGSKRIAKSVNALRKADAIIYAADARDFSPEEYEDFKRGNPDCILAFTKFDLIDKSGADILRSKYPESVFLSRAKGIDDLRLELIKRLSAQNHNKIPIIGDLLASGSTVVLVVPIDSEAPKGRLILPQVQTLRECLDYGIKCMVCREFELESALSNLTRVDLVITDSQAFKYVNERVPQDTPLTSFSMLLARQTGYFDYLLDGARKIDSLPNNAKILMLEGCSHNSSHEDIGRVKIPSFLQRKTKKSFIFEYYSGYDFPENITEFDFAIQCGSCMLNEREVINRMTVMRENSIPITNYGMVLAWINDIIDRASAIFYKEVKHERDKISEQK